MVTMTTDMIMITSTVMAGVIFKSTIIYLSAIMSPKGFVRSWIVVGKKALGKNTLFCLK